MDKEDADGKNRPGSQMPAVDEKDFMTGRIIRQDKERFIVSANEREYTAEPTGNLRFTADESSDLPAVGDWVLFRVFPGDLAIIYKVLPRKTILERQAVDKQGAKQVIAANIDVALIIQSVDQNFNVNRIERYLTICHSAKIKPVVLITKSDTVSVDYCEKLMNEIRARHPRLTVHAISNITKEGFDKVTRILKPGKTYCVIGSSGVGKSTLINNLTGRALLQTGEISKTTNKGRHVTSSRQLIYMENGSMLIDTPGMRELGITENREGLKATFEDIYTLSKSCRFADCTHTNEKGCAVNEAIKLGRLDGKTLENYRKMLKEQERFMISHAEKRKKDRERGKMYKSILEVKKRSKY